MSIAPRDRTASDWVAASLADRSFGDSLTVSGSLFLFRSANAGVNCIFAFVGVGVALGLGGTVLPVDVDMQPQNGARIVGYGYRPFSAGDLDGAGGIVLDAGGEAFGQSFGTLNITAYSWGFIPYFFLQPVPGPDSGLGLDVSGVEGRWKLLFLRDTRTTKVCVISPK
ncbi:MAG TPA: hypothetical protein VIJ79_03495 [Acidobacteriaceae bacterium]